MSYKSNRKKMTNPETYCRGNVEPSSFVGVILAAGQATRLRPMTNSIPKCLIKISGKPILQYQIDSYRSAGITNLIIVVGYRASAVREYCEGISDINIKFIENLEFETTNNMYSFYLAREAIGKRPFILNNADLIIDASLVQTLLSSPMESAVAIDSSQFNEESMKVSITEKGFLNNISKEISPNKSAGCSVDFYKVSAHDGQKLITEVVKIIEEEKKINDWTEIALQRLFKSGKLQFSAINIAGLRWVEVDDFQDVASADKKFSNFEADLKNFDALFIDLDGTVYLGDTIISGAAEAINLLKQSQKRVFFLSNNSSRSKQEYVSKLIAFGIQASEEDIILSSDAVLEFLDQKKIQRVHVLGTESLRNTIAQFGFDVDSDKPEVVIVGYDSELSYQKLKAACRYINNGVDFIATHSDLNCPSEFGPIPDAGAIVALLKLTTGKEPHQIFGKPFPSTTKSIERKYQLSPSRCLFIGDRLHTDVLMAKNNGSKSVLVLSGETKRHCCQQNDFGPDYILQSLAEVRSYDTLGQT